MVEVVVVDREAAVPRLAHSPGHVGGVDRDREPDHVDPGRHHLAHRGVAQVVKRGQDQLLLVPCGPLAAPTAPRAGSWRAVLGRVLASAEHGEQRALSRAGVNAHVRAGGVNAYVRAGGVNADVRVAGVNVVAVAPPAAERTGTGWKDSSWKVPPSTSRVVALRSLIGSRGLTIHPSAPDAGPGRHRRAGRAASAPARAGGCRTTPRDGVHDIRPCPPCFPSAGRR